jgi:CHASE2 domain-containing sensor protein/class 3 adenylate cyclase
MPRPPLAASNFAAAIAIALAAFAIAGGLRHAGMLDRVDLAVNDALVQAVVPAAPGDAFFVILEHEEDLPRYGFPLSDDALATLVEKIAAAEPAAIAIDKYRDRPVGTGGERLAAMLAKNDRIYWVAKFGTVNGEAVEAPAAIDKRFVGCGDLVDDPDGAVRRALIYMDDGGRVCYGLAFQLVRHLAVKRGSVPQFTKSEPPELVLGKARLRPIDPGDGPYIDADTAGFQVAIPTAAGLPAIETVGLADVMEGRVDPARMRGKVVLFGSIAPSLRDFFDIPDARELGGRRKIAGVQVHALIASHLLAASEAKAAKMALAPPRTTLVITAALAILMALIACSRKPSRVVWASGALILGVYGGAALWRAGTGNVFAPTAPALAAVLALSTGIARTAWLESRERRELMDIFSRHVSTEVADALWDKRSALIRNGVFVPRAIVATVMFLDIRSFTTVFEQLPADRAVPWLNRGLAAMTETIMRHNGVVSRFIGDSIMAVFGAPVPRANDAEIATDAHNAVRAALALGPALDKLNAEYSAESLPPMRIRVGINTGTMTQCSVGTDRRMEFTMLGDAVNTASRLESYGMPDDGRTVRILIGPRTMEIAGARFRTHEVGSIALKGKEKPVMLYQVEAAP